MRMELDLIKETIPKVGFLGLSHLGLVTSTVLSSFGVKTLCFDFDESQILELRNLKSLISEPGLSELLKFSERYQTFTSNLEDLNSCEIIYISLDVGTDNKGLSDLSLIKECLIQVSKVASKSILVILSQVQPGFTREISKLIPNEIYYQVETLVFGEAIERSKYPERIIIGNSNGTNYVNSKYVQILNLYACPILIYTYETAELTKVSINAFLASDVCLTNTLARLSDKINASWSDVSEALKLDKRIGKFRYLQAGLGITGGNIERDLMTISILCKQNEVDFSVIDSVIKSNSNHKSWVIHKLLELEAKNYNLLNIGLWGLSYKENTNSIKNSNSYFLIDKLYKKYSIYAHDPQVTIRDNRYQFADDPILMLSKIDVLIILTPWSTYRQYFNSELLNSMSKKIILDPYRVLSGEFCKSLDIQYVTLGENSYAKGGLAIE